MSKRNKITIDSIAYGGNGVGRYEGKVVFVPLTVPGDVVTFSPIKEKKGYIEAELVNVEKASGLRISPPCPVFGDCGGCSWQHIGYEDQACFKEEIFRETLWRLGTVEKERILPIIKADPEWHYRNRAQFKARFIDGKLHVGFYRRKSHYVIDIDSCPLMSPLINRLLAELKKIFSTAPFRGKMPQIDISVNDDDSRAVVIIHLTEKPSGYDFEFVEIKLGPMEDLEGVFFQSGRKSSLTKVFSMDNNGQLAYRLTTREKEVILSFSPGRFTQVNYRQNCEMVSTVCNLLKGRKIRKAIDLYCGIGNFSLPLAGMAEEVVGIETYEGAIEDARRNAKAAGIKNCSFIAGDAVKAIRELKLDDCDLAIVDPPRQGAATVIKQLAAASVPAIIYVSCNPTTLARDLRLLIRQGYEVTSSQPIDLFPQTWHIESVTLIEKKRV